MVRTGDGGWKRVALGGNKEKFVQIKGFLYVKRQLLRTVRKVLCKRKPFGLEWYTLSRVDKHPKN